MATRKAARPARASRPAQKSPKPVKHAGPATVQARTKAKPRAATRARPSPAPPPPPAPRAPPPETRDAELRAAWSRRLLELGLAPLSPGVWSRAETATPTTPVWLLVSQGLEHRGLGLTVRVPRTKDELAPPAWSVALLQSLAALAATGPVGDDQSLVLPGPVVQGSDLAAVAFALDPKLQPVSTEWDRVRVLTAVGLTRDEERLVREWSPRGLLEVLAVASPLLVTDPERTSMLVSPRARAVIEQRVSKEGSSLGLMTPASSSLTRRPKDATWALSSDGVDTFIALLKGRIAHQRPFLVKGERSSVAVVPGDVAGLVEVDGVPTLKLSQQAARQIRSILRGKPGRYTFDMIPAFTLEVV